MMKPEALKSSLTKNEDCRASAPGPGPEDNQSCTGTGAGNSATANNQRESASRRSLEWDKTYPRDERVRHCKVTFVNRYGITLAADLFAPKSAAGTLSAIAVSGPFGAVKEQVSGRYAQELAARGFLTIAFDPSFTGESGGFPRNVASPDINTEDFQAAVDFLSVQENVDPERIGPLC